jgi:hypothetical protein
MHFASKRLSSLSSVLSRRAIPFAGVLLLGVCLAAAGLSPHSASAQDQTFTIDSSADDSDANVGDGTCATSNGTCTLRAAIEEANSDATRDKVDFSSIPTTNGFATISANSELSADEEINIAGNTAPNYPSSSTGGPIVKIEGSNISGSTADILEVRSSDSKVEGLAIVNAPDDGIELFAGNVTVKGCFLGMDVDGTTTQGNGDAGLVLNTSSSATVNNNLVSGNSGNGIKVNGNGNLVINNYVGVDYDGDAAKGNGGHGIMVPSGSNDNRIGNAYLNVNTFQTVDNGNVVSANGQNGIFVRGDGNQVSANEIGTSADGSTATGTDGNSLGNQNNGIEVVGTGTGSSAAQNNLVGQNAPGTGTLITVDGVGADRNLISGNAKDGIALGNDAQGEASSQDTLRNNVIGLNKGRDAKLPNGADTDVDGGIVGSLTNDAVIDSNVVAGNAGQGIIIFNGNRVDIVDNVVGTNRNFATGLGNAYDGIQVKPNPSFSDRTQVTDNIVGNNDNDGIDIRGSYYDVANNYIGVAPDGSDIGNGVNDQGRGIVLDNGSSSLDNSLIGGLTPSNIPGDGNAAGNSTPDGTGNVIGNNRADGILVRGNATDLVMQQNYIGTNPSDADLGNGSGATGSGGDGIRIVGTGNASTGHHIGYNGSSSFSSPDPANGGDGNVVAFNNSDGISLGSSESSSDVKSVPVRGNLVYQNGAANNTKVGIDLGNSGQTSNDAGDGDSGPNGLQNFPLIQSVNYDESNSTVTIDYEVKTNDTGSNYPLKVDFYVADSEQSGEGKIYLGSQDYSTANATASVSFDLSHFSNVSSEDYFVATATDANGNTSEFFGPPGQQLPVELASFEAQQSDDGAVRLTWKTASEQNNAGFRVQHRSPETNSWSKVGFVESKAEGGSATEALSYRFTAEDLGVGTHRFRLQQVDLSGTTHAHDPVAVEVQMQEALRLAPPAPNPVRDRASVRFAVREKKETTLQLYNTLGQRVATIYRGTPPAGEQRTVQLGSQQLSDLSSGVYFLRLRAGEQTATRRVTVVR